MCVNCRINALMVTKHRLKKETSSTDPWLQYKNVENGIECQIESGLDKRVTLSGSSGSIGENPAKNGVCRIMYRT